MSTRRACLAGWKNPHKLASNAGLWLDKFIENQYPGDTSSKRNLVDEVSEIPVPETYAHWFELWRKMLRDYGAVCKVASVMGRMIVGLGNESVLETSVTLHRVFGVPYIPGTALKGVTARFVREYLQDEWQPSGQRSDQHCVGPYEVVFGDTDTAGYVTFFDAMPLPDSRLLYSDVVTVHHKDYYGDGGKPPADWDNPNPVPFLSATGRYLLALAGPPRWVDATFDLMTQALKHIGVGAKTSSGYGKLAVVEIEEKPASAGEDPKVAQLLRQLRVLKTSEVPGRIRWFYEQWRNVEASPGDKRCLAEAILEKVKEAGKERNWRDQEWYKELLASIQA
ncbi:MAG: type III-B CRISPR module RAMP protein Cmr6 [Firmicutes bacterium]|nr:type III-B CRISPR module RAMP protein Cmr6 [Candidatus Fermentithermobacillaceae bacterium]